MVLLMSVRNEQIALCCTSLLYNRTSAVDPSVLLGRCGNNKLHKSARCNYSQHRQFIGILCLVQLLKLPYDAELEECKVV